jgi:hypothetical protein
MDEPQASDEFLEKRATIRLLRYWQSLRFSGIAPSMRELDPKRISVPWEDCFLIAVGDRPENLIFDHIGKRLSASPNEPSELLRHVTGEIGELVEKGAPILRDDRFTFADGRRVLYRSIMVLFTDIARRPRYALGSLNFRVLAA